MYIYNNDKDYKERQGSREGRRDRTTEINNLEVGWTRVAGEERKVTVLIEARTKARSVMTEGETKKLEEREIGDDAKNGTVDSDNGEYTEVPLCIHVV